MLLKLREVRVEPATHKGYAGFMLSDPLYLSPQAMFVPGPLAELLMLMDGTRDIEGIKISFELRVGVPLQNTMLEEFVSQLDAALLLDNDRYAQAYQTALKEYRSAPARPPALAGGCYPADTGDLTDLLSQYFDWAEKVNPEPPKEVRGLICPHIDYARGSDVYARVWSQVKSAVKEAELVVVLGTDHNEGTGRITLTRQSYQTPWGILPTAQDIVEELIGEIGDDTLTCELNHCREHSVESALIWLHYLLRDSPCHLLPILCGSFHPFIEQGRSPREEKHIQSAIEVIKRASEKRSILIIAAADLAHQGPVFGDSLGLDIAGKAAMAAKDEELMNVINSGDAEAFFSLIAAEKDSRHICGLPPIYIALSIMDGAAGTTMGYSQCPASKDETSLVSICGTIF